MPGIQYGPAEDLPLLLDELECVGNETDLLSCASSNVGLHDCSNLEIVGVECKR